MHHVFTEKKLTSSKPTVNKKKQQQKNPNSLFSAVFTKVSQFEFPSVIDEQILGLQVPVEDFPSVTVRQPSQDLEQKNLKKKTFYISKLL